MPNSKDNGKKPTTTKTKRPSTNPDGRKPIPLDADQIHELAKIQCTYEEMAAVMKCSVDTLQRRFAAIIKSAQQEGKTSLRRWQYKAAKRGNVVMMIWLGKQILGQRDHRDVNLKVEDESKVEREIEGLLEEAAAGYKDRHP